MQQVSFVPVDGHLELNAFYASQQVLLKGFGNYLGLMRLGQFVGEQMGLIFRAVNVFAGAAKIDALDSKSPRGRALIEAASEVIKARKVA
jgi:hypothetical protein